MEALSNLVRDLPSNLEAAVVIVQHLSRSEPSRLAEILGWLTPLKVKQAAQGDRLCHKCIFLAPPDRHVLIVAGGTLQLSSAPRIHYTRPSAEPLFCSAAAVYQKNVIAVVLTGADSDASLCIQEMKNTGGKVIVQDAATSADFSMPRAAIKADRVDSVLPLHQIAGRIVELVNGLNGRRPPSASS